MKPLPSEARFFASDERALPDFSSLDELLAADGPDSGKGAFGAMLEEAQFLILEFGFSGINALYRAAAVRGVLEPYTAWRQRRLTARVLLERLSETDPTPRYLPLRLYRYMSLNSTRRQGFARRLLQHGELYHASPGTLNDPHDCSPSLQPEALVPVFREMIDAQVGIVSFSADNANQLMWAHYADGERGICVEIDTRYLLCKEESEEIALLPVNYIPSARLLGPFDDSSATRNAVALLTIKRPHWSYEREWRLTKMWDAPPNATQRCLKLGEPLVTAVLVGRRIAPRSRKQIALWASRRRTAIPVVVAPLS